MNSPSDRSIRPLSSTEGGAADIAGQGGIGQEEATEGEKINEVDEQEEEVTARDPRVARRPMKPTKAMIQSHELHHADYRDWCDHCRAGKGVSHQHRSSTNDNNEAEFQCGLCLYDSRRFSRDGKRHERGRQRWSNPNTGWV